MGLIENLIYLMKTELGSVIISIIWGLGLAALFRQTCKNRNCIVIKAPDVEEVKDQVYKFDSSCFTFNTNPAKCMT